MPSVHVKGVCSSCGAPNSCNAGVQGLLGDSLSSAVLSEWRMLQDAVLTCPFPEQGLEKPPGHGLQLGPKKPLQHFGSCKMKQILLPIIWNNPSFRAGHMEPELPCIYRGPISGRHQGWYQGWGLQQFLKEKKKEICRNREMAWNLFSGLTGRGLYIWARLCHFKVALPWQVLHSTLKVSFFSRAFVWRQSSKDISPSGFSPLAKACWGSWLIKGLCWTWTVSAVVLLNPGGI